MELDNPSSIVDHLFNNFSYSDIVSAMEAHGLKVKSTRTLLDICDEVSDDLCNAIEDCDGIKNLEDSQRKQFILNQLLLEVKRLRNAGNQNLEDCYAKSTYYHETIKKW